MLSKLFRYIATIVGGAVGYGVYKLTQLVFSVFGWTFFSKMSLVQDVVSAISFVIIFGLLFFILAPIFSKHTGNLAKNIETDLQNVSFGEVIMGTVGLLLGLFLALMLSNLYGLIDAPYIGVILSTITFLVFGYVGLIIGRKQGPAFVELLKTTRQNPTTTTNKQQKNKKLTPKILDTSVIIDGRIVDIMEAGFIEGRIIIPEFVLVELRHIADSSDSLKRNRGRRGLDILNKIRDDYGVEIYDSNKDKYLDEIPEVDVKLLKLAQNMNGKVVTNDFNLNKVAGINGVPVLNINELALALKPVALPGEDMRVFLVKEGKERAQALGYLEDGTMIVVEDGRKFIGKTIDVTVSSALQTAAGRMIFAKPAMGK